MSTLSIAIIIVFVVGYLFIALESVTKVNKAAVALLMFVVVWTLYMINPGYFVSLIHPQFMDVLSLQHPGLGSTVNPVMVFVTDIIQGHLGDTGTTLFFLMGAMTIVEVVDQNGGFDWVRRVMHTKSKRVLLWRIAFMTFILSAILDNMTTSIVMIMILRKLVSQHKDRVLYAALVIISANSGGAFSPIGDVTTIMLWNKGLITAAGVISEILIPSLVSMVVPALIIQMALKGNLDEDATQAAAVALPEQELSDFQRKVVFWVGVGGLVFVPIFKSLTHLPPFMGILLVLSLLWIVTEVFYAHLKSDKGARKKRVVSLIRNIDMSTILFFLGILMAVSCLEEIGALTLLGKGLNVVFDGNHFMVTGIIGVLSSIVDNVPLVAGCMGMYPVQAVGDFATDGVFWQLLAYCAGVGGSMLIIGSAAGVVVMGLEKITFGWYMKHVSWIAFVGYIAGILCYYVFREYIFTTPL
ncbi:MAG: sodium:proton antiporter NhaD [Prevotella sp.]|nr:sodium:proton antiporter NhaD [Prevotella sp.]MDD7189648.1 sodium:proton antiporter NhaD [Prevotella sp.]MDY5313875.1 sodium:proton antiporter NhaD [Prevotella sp.]